MKIFQNKLFLVIIAVALFLLGIMLYEWTGTSNFAENTAGTVISPAQSGVTGIRGFFSSVVNGLFNYGNVVNENEELKDKLTEAEGKLADLAAFDEENRQLKQLLELKDQNPDFKMTKASVISKEPGDWYDIFTINRGSLSGIRKNCAVITAYGLTGIVQEVGPNYSKVMSVLNTSSVVGAVVPRTGDIAIMESELDLYKNGKCKMNFLDQKTRINIGDIVETSGLGGIVPAGIRIGRIEDIVPDEFGVSRYAVIQPTVDFSRLRSVYVITNFEGMSDTAEATENGN